MMKWIMRLICLAVTPTLLTQKEETDLEIRKLKADIESIRRVNNLVFKAVGRADGFDGGNWAVVVTRMKDRDQAHLFRFNERNPAAVIDMLYRFEKAGADTRLIPQRQKGHRI